jgi:hypothetical protein
VISTTRAEIKHLRKSRDGLRGVLVKTQRRVASGVCPCCTRSFQNLARHMDGEHPNYVPPVQP